MVRCDRCGRCCYKTHKSEGGGEGKRVHILKKCSRWKEREEGRKGVLKEVGGRCGCGRGLMDGAGRLGKR